MSGNNHKKTIGILGGMGPFASSHVYAKIIELAQERYNAEQDTDYPPMVLYSLPLKGFDETGPVDEDLVREQLVEGVRMLESGGSDFIIIACNTVHVFLSDIREAVSIPVVDLPDQTAFRVKKEGYGKVGLLSSQTTRETGLYSSSLRKYDVGLIQATEEEQDKLNSVILHVMSGNYGSSDARTLQDIMERMSGVGAEAFVLGCTEMPLVTHKHNVSKPIFDTIVIAAEEALARSMPGTDMKTQEFPR